MLNIEKEQVNGIMSNLISYSYPPQFQLTFPTKKFIMSSYQFKDYQEVKEFSVFLYGTVLPGVSLQYGSIKWMGATVKLPNDIIDFGQWNSSFIIDENLFNWIYFFEWLTWMHNNKDVFTQDFPDYCVDGTLKILNNWNKPIARFKIINISPESLGEIVLSSQDGSNISTSQISFVYDRLELESKKTL